MKPAIGQYWKDVVNGDLLKILGFSLEEVDTMRSEVGENGPIEPPSRYGIEYVRCACFVSGHSFFGVQEMKSSRLNGIRFKLVKPWWWERWKLTKQLYRRNPESSTEKARSAKS